MQEALTNSLNTVATFLPKLVMFLLILLIGIFIAKMVAKVVGRVLEKVGFDRAVERGGVKKALEKSSLDASDIVAKLAYYAIGLFVLQLAFGVFGPNPISELITSVIAFLPRLIVAIVIVVVASAIAAAVKTLIEGTLGGLSYGKVLAGIAATFILFLGVIAALNQIGVATTVTTPVLIAILATLSGVIIVGAGGGLIKPMQHRWEGYLVKAEQEVPRIKQTAAVAPSMKEQAQQARSRAQARYEQAGPDQVDAVPTNQVTTELGAGRY
jgi:Conserved TM helix